MLALLNVSPFLMTQKIFLGTLCFFSFHLPSRSLSQQFPEYSGKTLGKSPRGPDPKALCFPGLLSLPEAVEFQGQLCLNLLPLWLIW